MLGLDEAEAFFGRSTTGASACRRVVRAKCYAVHSGQFADSEARPVLTPRQDEGMSSRTTRGCWKLGAISCLEASWSEELDDKELHGAPGAREDRSQEFPIFWTTSSYRLLMPIPPATTVWYACFKRLSKFL